MVSMQNRQQPGSQDDKYTPRTLNGSSTPRWEPGPITQRQFKWQHRALTFVASFMTASLVYTLLSALHPLPPSPDFVLMLAGMLPAAAIGAMVVQWNRSHELEELVKRALTAMGCTLIGVASVEAFLQLLIHIAMPPLQMFIVLVVAALCATFGAHERPCAAITRGLATFHTALGRIAWLTTLLIALVGGGLGYVLTLGFAFSIFTLSGILVGAAIGGALMWLVTYLVQQKRL